MVRSQRVAAGKVRPNQAMPDARDAADAPRDALDAPGPGDDGATSLDVGPGVDSGIVIVLDSGRVDSEGVDGSVVILDTSLDSTAADAPVDSPADAAADLPVVDTAAVEAFAGTCIEQIISNGYAFTGAPACSACVGNQTPPNPLDTECRQMLDCLQAPPGCTKPGTPTANCWTDCLNSIPGGTAVTAPTSSCVSALTTAAACPQSTSP